MIWFLAYLVLGVLCAELGLWSNQRRGRTDYGAVAYLFMVMAWFAVSLGTVLAVLIIVLVHGRRLW